MTQEFSLQTKSHNVSSGDSYRSVGGDALILQSVVAPDSWKVYVTAHLDNIADGGSEALSHCHVPVTQSMQQG